MTELKTKERSSFDIAERLSFIAGHRLNFKTDFTNRKETDSKEQGKSRQFQIVTNLPVSTLYLIGLQYYSNVDWSLPSYLV